VRNLQSMDAGLRHDEQIIQGQFSARQSGQFLVVYGSDEASSAAREAVLLAQLRELVSRGQLSGFQALGQWLPTAEVQASTLQALQRLPDSVLREYSAASGIEYADLSAWRSGLRHAVPLQAAAVAAPQLQRWQIGRQIRLVTLSGIGDYRRVASLGVLPGVQFVDPVNELSATFSRYRIYGSWLVALATLLLAGILAWRYGCAAVPAMLGPVLLSILCTLLLLLACGVAINLFVIMALFLILGIGVDYSIFYRESYAHGASVVVGVSLCMLSTALGFGLLAISHTSVIHAFGLTVLFGVGSSFLFATLITSAQPDGESLQ